MPLRILASPPGAAVPHHGVATWPSHGQAGIVVLLAGPGAGKTAYARALVEASGAPTTWVSCAPGSGEDLWRWLDLPASATPATVVAALGQRLRPGSAIVFERLDLLEDEGAIALLARWLKDADAGVRTIITSRLPPPFPIMGDVARGRIQLVGAADLWLTPDEASELLAGVGANPDLVAALEGWPLGLAALRRIGSRPDATPLIEALVGDELVAALPPRWLAAARALAPYPLVSAALASHVLAGEDGTMLGALASWGILREGEGGFRWHPLVRKTASIGAHRLTSDLGEWLAEHEPALAIPFFLERESYGRAARLMRRQGLQFQPDQMTPALASVPPDLAEPEIDLLRATLLRSQGAFVDAGMLLDRALKAFLTSDAPGPGAFAVHVERMMLCIEHRDGPGLLEAERLATPLAPLAEPFDQGRFLLLRGSRLLGEERSDEAILGYEQILDLPRLGAPAVARLQQAAALNLGTILMMRGDLESAERQLHRGLAMEPAPHLGLKGLLGANAALVATLLGAHDKASAALDRLDGAPCEDEDPHRAALFHVVLGTALMNMGRRERAEAHAREALQILTAANRETCVEAGSAMICLGHCHLQAGELEVALRCFDRALEVLGQRARFRAEALLGKALACVAGGRHLAALEALGEAEEAIGTLPAPYQATEIVLARAAAHDLAGDKARAGRALDAALARVRTGNYDYLLLAQRAIAPAIWRLIQEFGHQDIVNRVTALFPEAVRGLRPCTIERPAPLAFHCLGGFEVAVAGRPVRHWKRRKSKLLLAFLLLNPRGLRRDELLERLFEDLPHEEASGQFDNVVYATRSLLEPERSAGVPSTALLIRDGRYVLNAPEGVVDLHEFERAYHSAKQALASGDAPLAALQLECAMGLYKGSLFADPFLAEWFELERQQLRNQAFEVYTAYAELMVAQGGYERAHGALDRWLALEPANEDAHRLKMLVFGLQGDKQRLRTQYELCERVLTRELATAPDRETVAMLERFQDPPPFRRP